MVNKVIIKVRKYNSNDGIEYESEDESEDESGMKVKMMVLNIICISVIMGLVSITPGHVKLD